MHLVDLSGSERIYNTGGSEGGHDKVQKAEANSINQSLFML
jgi:hypothetical protein